MEVDQQMISSYVEYNGCPPEMLPTHPNMAAIYPQQSIPPATSTFFPSSTGSRTDELYTQAYHNDTTLIYNSSNYNYNSNGYNNSNYNTPTVVEVVQNFAPPTSCELFRVPDYFSAVPDGGGIPTLSAGELSYDYCSSSSALTSSLSSWETSLDQSELPVAMTSLPATILFPSTEGAKDQPEDKSVSGRKTGGRTGRGNKSGGAGGGKGGVTGGRGGGGRPSRRKRKSTPTQRVAANVRERKRMSSLNSSFDRLRRKVPAFPHEKKLSRIQTLRLAIRYVDFMLELMRAEVQSSGGQPSPPSPQFNPALPTAALPSPLHFTMTSSNIKVTSQDSVMSRNDAVTSRGSMKMRSQQYGGEVDHLRQSWSSVMGTLDFQQQQQLQTQQQQQQQLFNQILQQIPEQQPQRWGQTWT